MRKFIVAITIILLAQLTTNPVKAETITESPNPLNIYKVYATAYCISGTTATGTQTAEGRTVASKPEWFGATMYVWEDKGDGIIHPENFIGMFTVEDTGGETVKSGRVIDVFIDDYQRAKQFGSKRVIVQIIKSEG